MNLKEAVAEIAGEFGAEDRASPPPEKVIVTSGGIKEKGREPEPVLCISRELAVELWVREMQNFLDNKPFVAYQFIDGPHLDRWNMTTMDGQGQQRLAEPRFSVSATVGIEWVTEETKSEDSANPFDALMAIPRI